MSKLTPLSWRDFVRKLHKFGFDGPYAGGKHLYMVKGNIVLAIPNPHRREISVDLISRILRQAKIARREWEHLQKQK